MAVEVEDGTGADEGEGRKNVVRRGDLEHGDLAFSRSRKDSRCVAVRCVPQYALRGRMTRHSAAFGLARVVVKRIILLRHEISFPVYRKFLTPLEASCAMREYSDVRRQ